MTLAKVAADLYASLKMMPCRCQQRFEKGVLTTTERCSRCRALKEYEQLFPPSSAPSPPSDEHSNQQTGADL